jgi:hypothetical protein
MGTRRTAFAVLGSGFGVPVRASTDLLTFAVPAVKSTSAQVSASSSLGRTYA